MTVTLQTAWDRLLLCGNSAIAHYLFGPGWILTSMFVSVQIPTFQYANREISLFKCLFIVFFRIEVGGLNFSPMQSLHTVKIQEDAAILMVKLVWKWKCVDVFLTLACCHISLT